MKPFYGYLTILPLLVVTSFSHAVQTQSTYRGMGTAKTEFPHWNTLKSQGAIAKKPDIARADYNDVYKVKKPIVFLGQNVIALSDEYMTEYAGCCISEGWGAVITQKADLKPLEKFARDHQCSLEKMSPDNKDYYGFKLTTATKDQNYELSCRERDLPE